MFSSLLLAALIQGQSVTVPDTDFRFEIDGALKVDEVDKESADYFSDDERIASLKDYSFETESGATGVVRVFEVNDAFADCEKYFAYEEMFQYASYPDEGETYTDRFDGKFGDRFGYKLMSKADDNGDEIKYESVVVGGKKEVVIVTVSYFSKESEQVNDVQKIMSSISYDYKKVDSWVKGRVPKVKDKDSSSLFFSYF